MGLKANTILPAKYYALVAPNGDIQTAFMHPDYMHLLATLQTYEAHKLCKPLKELFEMGCQILPVEVSVKAIGDEAEYLKGHMNRKPSKLKPSLKKNVNGKS